MTSSHDSVLDAADRQKTLEVPQLFHALPVNNDFMRFVFMLLISGVRLGSGKSAVVMMLVRTNGKSCAKTYSRAIKQTRSMQCNDFPHCHGCPSFICVGQT